MLTILEQLSSPWVFVGFVFEFSVECFVDNCLCFCLLSIVLSVFRIAVSYSPKDIVLNYNNVDMEVSLDWAYGRIFVLPLREREIVDMPV